MSLGRMMKVDGQSSRLAVRILFVFLARPLPKPTQGSAR